MIIPADKTFTYILYKCSCCGYETRERCHSSRHKKSIKCESPLIEKITKTAIDVDDLQELLKIYSSTTTTTNISGDHNGDIINYNDNKQITFNLTVPDGDTRTIIYKALKSQQFQRELNGEFQPENIPALIFRHTKGRGIIRQNGEKVIHVEDDKVHEKDSGGKLTKTPLNKYAKQFINDATCTLENNVNLIQPKFAKELVDDLKTENLPGHKRDEKVSGAEALKNYASGSHVVYKYPTETRGFVTRAVDAVKKDIRHANG
jgi:hypothetical protein